MDTVILSQARADKAQQQFVQATVAALERCALCLLSSFHLPSYEAAQLVKTLHDIRRSLKLPSPPHPLLALREWPADALAGEALGKLLNRLDALEVKMGVSANLGARDLSTRNWARNAAETNL